MRFGFSMAVAAAAMAARKRPAQDDARPAKARKKRQARYKSVEAYQLLEEIAEGAHGVAWKARDLRTGAMVAVKWIRREGGDEATESETIQACLREADCLAACRGHPGIVHFKNIVADTDTAGDSNNLYIVMELLGPSLRSRLTTRPFTEDETRDAMRQLLEAVEKMHAIGVIHRDINPDNILVGRDGKLKICGFGCAISGHVGNVPEKFTGTLQYRSPDHLNCCQFAGPKDDIWALGCVMAELLTGEPLITATTEEDALDATMELYDDLRTLEEEAFDDIGDLSLAGRQLLAGLLAFFPDERLTAADALNHRWFTVDDVEPKPSAAVQAVHSVLPKSQDSSR
ncbi:hypothetical protein HU200_038570 [Digitaria exilis]|uniref:[RNA-polymerase]-subunit kinase n=1 Tax=Digitaria exilis TaxID=1010633 RepID=A0A835BCC0_9POAL|nr:hypothetical protein HU200_038570 [Digitaria exilis]